MTERKKINPIFIIKDIGRRVSQFFDEADRKTFRIPPKEGEPLTRQRVVSSLRDTYTFNEVWSPELQRWIGQK